mmetsp:Transcript_54194/g.86155  ORF Transcript_54194/g.86155 Transcript_54194/m.86155 type:complete len:275 (-) Transcript_54194:144-968(-)
MSMTSDGKALPNKFVCSICGVCVAKGDNLQKTEDDVHIFSRLHGSIDADQGSKTVSCPCCDLALGSRGNNVFLLRKDRVVRGPERLEILVCSLKEKEITDVAPVLQEAFPQSNVISRVLQKAELRGFELKSARVPDFVVVVHKNEGRALLTDRNGFYHDVLGSAWQQTQGNVLVVLTRTETRGGAAELFDAQLLQSLSNQGDQPTIGTLSACGRVLTWENSPSRPQIQQLQRLSEKAYFREASSVVQGLPASWTKPLPKSSAASNSNFFGCNLL